MSALSDRGGDRFAALLEDAGSLATASEEDRILAELAAALGEVSTEVPPMRAVFREELRTSVLEAAREQHGGPALLTRLRDGARRVRYSTAALTGASTAAVALSGGGVALAAEHAQPDDLLYDVKVALEDLRLTFTFDQVARGERTMAYALDRMEEAQLATAEGADGAAAAALRGAADRTAEGSRALLDSGLVDPVIGLAADLSAEVAILEELRPQLGVEGAAAADALMDVIIEATEGVLEIIDVSQWPGPGVPTLPDLEVPQQTPGATTTPAPEITTPPVEEATPQDTPSAADSEPPTGGALIPGVPLPERPLPDGPLPGGSAPTPGLPGDPQVPPPDVASPGGDVVDDVDDGVGDVIDGAGDVIEGVGDAVDGVGDVVDDVGDGVGGAVDDVIDSVPDPVQSAIPDPLPDVIDDVGDVVDDVVDTVPAVTDPVGGAVGDVVDDVGDAVDDLLPGLGG